jgi:hypothetical protein
MFSLGFLNHWDLTDNPFEPHLLNGLLEYIHVATAFNQRQFQSCSLGSWKPAIIPSPSSIDQGAY